MRPRTLATFGLGSFALVVTAASCSLGLDETLIGRTGDATAPFPTGTLPPPGDGTVPDSPPFPPRDGGIDANATETCVRDDQCVPASACSKGRCDTVVNRCIYDICPQVDPCRAARCDSATNTCMPAVALPLHDEFPTIDQIAASGQYRAVAVVPPYAFVNTASGVYAYLLKEPGSPKTAIPVVDVPFVPQFLFASGRRVYMLGGVTGTQRRLPVAWLDVPRNAAAELRGESKFITYNGIGMNVALPAPLEKLTLGYSSPGYAFSVAEAPFPAPVGLNTVNVTQPTSFVVTSGADRMVGIRSASGTGLPSFSLLTGVGGGAITLGPDQAIPPAGGYFYNQASAQLAVSPKGAVAMSWPLNLQQLPYNGNVAGTRIAWILNDDKDTTFSSSDFIDVATFPSPGVPNFPAMAGPVAFADDRTLFATFNSPTALNTRVATGFFTRGPSDGGTGDAGTNTLTDFPMNANIYGVAAAPGVGAIVAYSSAINATVLHFVHQGCTP